MNETQQKPLQEVPQQIPIEPYKPSQEELSKERKELEQWFSKEDQILTTLLPLSLLSEKMERKLPLLIEGRTDALKMIAEQILRIIYPEMQHFRGEDLNITCNQILALADRRNYSVEKQVDINRFEDQSSGQLWVWEVRSLAQLKEWKSIAKSKREQRKEARKRLTAVVNCEKFGSRKKSGQYWLQKLGESKRLCVILEQTDDYLNNDEQKENQQMGTQMCQAYKQKEDCQIPTQPKLEADCKPRTQCNNDTSNKEKQPKLDEQNGIDTPQIQNNGFQKQKKQNKNKNASPIKDQASITSFFKKSALITKKSPPTEQNPEQLIREVSVVKGSKLQEEQCSNVILNLVNGVEDFEGLKKRQLDYLKASRIKREQIRGLPPPFSRFSKAQRTEQKLADQIHGEGCNAQAFPVYRRKLFWHPADSDAPGFYGSCKLVASQIVSSRRPFEKDENIDYEADEEEEVGEALEDEEDEDVLMADEESAEMENDGFFVPDGYLSEDEKDASSLADIIDDSYCNQENSSEPNVLNVLRQKLIRGKQQKKVIVISTEFNLQEDEVSGGTVSIRDQSILNELKVINLDSYMRIVKPDPLDYTPLVQQSFVKRVKLQVQKPVVEKVSMSKSIITYFGDVK